MHVYVKTYSSYASPHLEYVSFIWFPYKVGIIKYVEKVQKYFTRRLFIKCNIVYEAYLDRLEILKLLFLKLRRLICHLSICFNILEDFLDCNLKGCLVLNKGQNKGHQYKLLYT